MALTVFQWYVLIINVIAFMILTIDFQIYNHGGDGIKPEVLCNIVITFGGAFGALLAMLIWDRGINKANIQSRVYTLIWLVLQLAFYWAVWGPNRKTVMSHALVLFDKHKILCMYYVAINAITFIVFAIDKIKAMIGAWRIREIILLGLCLFGGGVGGFLAMDFCNHKVNTMYFMVGVPMMICIHLILFSLAMIGVF